MENYHNDIFISYRRRCAQSDANLIYKFLKNDGYDVFCDEKLECSKYESELLRRVSICKDFVLVLVADTFKETILPDGSANKNDWIYKEYTHAVECGKNIVVLPFAGFEWPEHLPDELKDLPDIHNMEINAQTDELFAAALHHVEEQHLKSLPRFKDSIKTTVPPSPKKKYPFYLIAGIFAICALLYFPFAKKADEPNKNLPLATASPVEELIEDTSAVTANPVKIAITGPENNTILNGHDAVFSVSYSCDKSDIRKIALSEGDIVPRGFTYESIEINSSKLELTRDIVFHGINAVEGFDSPYFVINGGTAITGEGDLAPSADSPIFNFIFPPSLSIKGPETYEVKRGSDITFTAEYHSGTFQIQYIMLGAGKIFCSGFKCDDIIISDGPYELTRTITLKNVQPINGKDVCKMIIGGSSAADDPGNGCSAAEAEFVIKD